MQVIRSDPTNRDVLHNGGVYLMELWNRNLSLLGRAEFVQQQCCYFYALLWDLPVVLSDYFLEQSFKKPCLVYLLLLVSVFSGFFIASGYRTNKTSC